ncbi:hypothetical protein ABMA70_14360 [Halobacteriovorax sp. XZX-3]|uniref:hypothetical protein n=1 Tax=unclassified Halobacteriovorax TaxID=2639665 RepID=UPI003720A5DA
MNKLIIVSLVACLCSSVYGRDLLYGTFEQEYSGSIKAQIDKNITEFKTKADKIETQYEKYISDCKSSFRITRNYKVYANCKMKQGYLFEKNFGGSPAYIISKIDLNIENIYVADIFKSAKGKESIGKLGIKFEKEPGARDGVQVKIYVKLKNEHYSDFVFTYGVVEKFENGRVKLLSNQDMWINVDDVKEVFKFKDDVFKLTREELKKKYTFAGKSLGCEGKKFACVDSCGVSKVKDDHVIMYLESDDDLLDEDKVLINELLNSNGEFACYVNLLL